MAQDNSQDSAGGSFDPYASFQSRRLIYKSVEEMQRIEHEVLNKFSQLTMTHKGELLKILSDWLLAQETPSPTFREVEAISQCSMQSWIALQSQATELYREFERTQMELEEVDRAYKQVVPLAHIGLGAVNHFFADKANKPNIQGLAADLTEKRIAHEKQANLVQRNVLERQSFGRRFLHGCMSNLTLIERSSVFGTRIQGIIRDFRATFETEWLKYMESTQAGVQIVTNGIEDLHRIYKI